MSILILFLGMIAFSFGFAALVNFLEYKEPLGVIISIVAISLALGVTISALNSVTEHSPNKCDKAGGVVVDDVCLDKKAVIDLGATHL